MGEFKERIQREWEVKEEQGETEREHRNERCVLRVGVNAAVDGLRLKDSLSWLLQ